MRTDKDGDSSGFESLIHYIFTDVLVGSENAMNVVEDELRVFSEKSMLSYHLVVSFHNTIKALPTFLADEKERATSRYVNITTIATFFSSVTATTLQMSISITNHSAVWDVVNFFWFTSLVFSVSSGVNSLLGMTWRKSSMYVVHTL